jgi:hypothetical protein
MTFDPSKFTAEQIQNLISILQNVQTPDTFEGKVEEVRNQRVTKRLNEIEYNLNLFESINAAFQVALTETIGDQSEAEWIVGKLDFCRRLNNFHHFSTVYRKYNKTDLKFEEMLKCLAAIYRLKVNNYNHPAGKYRDRAIVRREIRCPYCGELAQKLVQFLTVRGIKWE